MHGLTSGSETQHGFVRSASLLAGCIAVAALFLAPIAFRQSGSGSFSGLAIAAAICFASGLLAELVAAFLSRTSPFGAALMGMMVRMILPLGVCVGLAAMGQSGREHLAFIAYLLVFYLVTLVLETCLAVKRMSGNSTSSKLATR